MTCTDGHKEQVIVNATAAFFSAGDNWQVQNKSRFGKSCSTSALV